VAFLLHASVRGAEGGVKGGSDSDSALGTMPIAPEIAEQRCRRKLSTVFSRVNITGLKLLHGGPLQKFR